MCLWGHQRLVERRKYVRGVIPYLQLNKALTRAHAIKTTAVETMSDKRICWICWQEATADEWTSEKAEVIGLYQPKARTLRSRKTCNRYIVPRAEWGTTQLCSTLYTDSQPRAEYSTCQPQIYPSTPCFLLVCSDRGAITTMPSSYFPRTEVDAVVNTPLRVNKGIEKYELSLGSRGKRAYERRSRNKYKWFDTS